jgi:aldose 1-epimerase
MSCEVGLLCTPHPPRRPAVTGGHSLWPTDHAIAKPAPPLTAGRTPGSTVTGLLSVLAMVLAVVLGALAPPEAAARTAVIRSVFGTLPDGGVVELYRLSNSKGMQVSVINYGGIITSIQVPDRNGKRADVVLGYDSLGGYVKNPSYFGALVGRYANRVGKAQFTLDGKTYRLAANNDANSLHGGLKGFDKALWKATPLEDGSHAGVVLTYTSVDGEEGYPGNLSLRATFTLSESNELSMEYSATTDKPTVINLTHHDYFNLAGEGSGDVLGHRLQLFARRYTPVNAAKLPVGELAPVAGTPLDFVTPRLIGEGINADHEQIRLGGGYDHNFVINPVKNALALAARVEEPKSGRVLEVRTTEPGVQLYTANHLDGSPGKAGHRYAKHGAFCLETQHFPDSPNQASFPTTVLRPGQTFRSQTVYAFSVK